MSLRVSVVVPTYKRHDLLVRCLAALSAQSLPRSRYEVIVADDAASPETQRLVEAWTDQTDALVRYLPVQHSHGPAAARNAGWRAARGSIIAFTDDDCVPDHGWLAAGLAALDGPDPLDAAWGSIRMPLPPRPTDYERDAAGLERSEFVTANCFCRREALEQIGGFDERFTAAWREDADLYFSLLEAGKRVVHLPEALVVHPVRPAPWGVSLRQQRKSQFDALLYKKHPHLFRQKIRSGLAPYYGVGASLATCLAALAAGWTNIALVAGAVWVALTAQFCWRRLKDTSRAPGHVAEMIVTSILIPPLALFSRLRGAARYRVLYL